MKKENLKTTTNRKTYKIILRRKIYDDNGLCHYCGPHSGCNSYRKKHPLRNWKQYRKTQWK